MAKTDTNTRQIVLPPVIDLSSVQELKQLLQENSENLPSILLDGSQVTRITTPGVQILLSLDKSNTTGGLKMHILTPSESLQAAFSDLGLKNRLTQWSAS